MIPKVKKSRTVLEMVTAIKKIKEPINKITIYDPTGYILRV